jgi:hypothetical protein
MAGRLRFKNGVPFSFKLITAVIVLNFIAEFALIYAVPRLATRVAIGSHTYAIARGHNIYFVNPWLGRYLTIGSWAQFVLLGLLVLVLFLNRSQIEREN